MRAETGSFPSASQTTPRTHSTCGAESSPKVRARGCFVKGGQYAIACCMLWGGVGVLEDPLDLFLVYISWFNFWKYVTLNKITYQYVNPLFSSSQLWPVCQPEGSQLGVWCSCLLNFIFEMFESCDTFIDFSSSQHANPLFNYSTHGSVCQPEVAQLGVWC